MWKRRHKDCKSQMWQMTPKEGSTRYNRTNKHTNPWMLWEHVQDLRRFEVDGVLAPGGRSRHRVLLLTKKLSAIYTCWKREHQFSPWSITGYINDTPRQASYPEAAGQQHITRLIEGYFCDFLFAVFWHFFVLLVFCQFIWIFIFKRVFVFIFVSLFFLNGEGENIKWVGREMGRI